MKERPIIMSGESVRAILAGRKTQTRRVIRHPPLIDCDMDDCPYGQIGDRLWVRETWTGYELGIGLAFDDPIFVYRADGEEGNKLFRGTQEECSVSWHSPIHMPRKIARIELEITDIRVQRIQEISAGDVEAEGIDVISDLPLAPIPHDSSDDLILFVAQRKYRAIWDALNAKRGFGWESNPWVWALTFCMVKGGENES
jgi:hypothetical protein